MIQRKGSIEGFLDDENEEILLKEQIADWRNLKTLTRKIGLATHPEVRKKYTTDLYNGVKDYWNKYHIKFDFSRQPDGEEEQCKKAITG